MSGSINFFEKSSVSIDSKESPAQVEDKAEKGHLASHQVSHLLNYEEGLQATDEIVVSVNEVVISIFEKISATAERVGNVLEHQVLNGVFVVEFVKDVKWWISGKSHSIFETISKVFLTTMRGIKSTLFISSLGAFDLSKIAVTIGRIPVIGMVVNVLVIGGYGSKLIKDFKEYSRISNDLKSLEKTLEDSIHAGNSELVEENSEISEVKNQIKAKKILLHGTKAEIIADIASVIFSILTIMAFCTGWGALAMTGALMISLSITASAMMLYSCYYGEKHKSVEDKPVVNSYAVI